MVAKKEDNIVGYAVVWSEILSCSVVLNNFDYLIELDFEKRAVIMIYENKIDS